MNAQKDNTVTPISGESMGLLQAYEDSLQHLFNKIRTSKEEKQRFAACYQFIPMLVKALQTPNSYYFPFDSLENDISILTSPDNKFRIFTWMVIEEKKSRLYTYKYFGAIQQNTDELQLMALNDKSSSVSSPKTVELNNEEWYGALYYDIQHYQHNNEDFYLLFGWDANTNRSDKKIAEVMFFRDDKAIFGLPVFEVLSMDGTTIDHRLMLEFKEGSSVNVSYNDDKEMIVYDFLTPEDEEAASVGKNFAYVPDGTYLGMQFDQTEGIWKGVSKVFNYITPVSSKPKPILDDEKPAKKVKERPAKEKKNETKKPKTPTVNKKYKRKMKKRKKKRGMF
ncbi:MAG: hypothetical protein ACPG5B_07525 [Chitinophagales bacterium]